MKPYYEEPGITIYHGDCLEVLPQLPDGRLDIVVTDPPYNVGLHYGMKVNDQRFDYEEWCRQWFMECQRCAPLIAMTPGIANLAMWCRIAIPKWIMAWLKPDGRSRIRLGLNRWEPVMLWGEYPCSCGTDVINSPIQPLIDAGGHPCPKPLKLCLSIVGRFSQPGQTILDPFMGLGTTLLSAKELGRNAIGIDIEERYCEIAVNRLRQGVLPLVEVANAN